MLFQDFAKRNVDPRGFLPVPESLYTDLGGIEKNPIRLAVASRLLARCNWGNITNVELHNGRTFVLGMGETWISMTGMTDDINAACGTSYTRRQVQYATRTLAGVAFTESRNPLEGTRGKFGRIYTISNSLLSRDEPMIDVIKAYRLYYYGDHKEFNRGEIVTGELNNRGKYGMADGWMRWVAERGIDRSAYTTVGRWRRGEEGSADAPVFVPWVTIDIDRGTVVTPNGFVDPDVAEEAYADTREIVESLQLEGFDLDRCIVSVSGMKGFHISIPTDHFGSPIFFDTISARESIAAFVRNVTELETDTSLNSPTSLIRLSGSVHNVTGARKRSYTASRFMRLPLHEILRDIHSHIPFSYPDPTAGEIEERTLELFEQSAVEAAEKILQMREDAKRYGSEVGGTISRILQGIAEGEAWSDRHVGRNKASYILACWLIESEKQQRGVAYHLGVDLAVYGTTDTARQLHEEWNARCEPPLSDSELIATFRSAQRTIRDNA